MEDQSISLILLLIIVTAVPCFSNNAIPAVIETTSLTTTEGSCVEIKCKVTGYLPDEDALWFWMKDGTWDEKLKDYSGTIVYSNKIRERPISPQFEGRVTYTGSPRLANRAGSHQNPSCSVLICNLTVQDSGTYFFRYISQRTKWKTLQDAVLNVTDAPHDTEAVISSSDVTEGHSVTLTCSAKGRPTPTFTWNKRQDTLSPVHTEAIWNINSVQIEHSGEYFCTAHNKHGTQRSNIVQINVKYAPSVEASVSSQPPYRQGQTVTLTCNVIRSKPPPHTFIWYKDEQTLSWSQTYVKSLQSEDSGSYKCSAENTVATTQSSPLQIDVQYRPRNTNIVIVGQNSRVAVGGSVVFKCNTKANPPAHEHYWYRDRNHHQTTAENSLELRSVQRTDEGCYSCSASNWIGSGDRSTDLCIEVQYPPTKLTLSMETEVTEGQRISITCRVDSSPKSTLTLSRTSEGSTEELQKETDLNSLSYTVTVSSAHSGEYTCSAHNSLGSESTRSSLRVKYGPQKVTVQADPGLTVKENETLTLHCSAQSHPPVTNVTWTRGNLTVHTGPTFSVESVSVSDSGLYSCTAHNEIGQRTSPPAEVKVKFGPKHTEVVRAEEVQSPDGSRSVTLSCSSHSFPPVSLYTWYRRTEGRELKVSENRTYTVVSTQPGVYYCTAKNNISETTSEPVSLFQDGDYVMFILLTFVPFLIILLIALFIFRLRRKNSVQEASSNTSFGSRVQGGNSRNDPGPQQRADITNGTAAINTVYSTVNLPKDKRGLAATGEQQEHPLYYASIHLEKRNTSMPVKTTEDVVYSTVKLPDQDTADAYENITAVQKAKYPNLDPYYSDEENEVDVNYTQVNFRTKGWSREGPRLSEGDEREWDNGNSSREDPGLQHTADITIDTSDTVDLPEDQQEMADYENIDAVQKETRLQLCDSDRSEVEVDVSNSQVNFRRTAQCREDPGLSEVEVVKAHE